MSMIPAWLSWLNEDSEDEEVAETSSEPDRAALQDDVMGTATYRGTNSAYEPNWGVNFTGTPIASTSSVEEIDNLDSNMLQKILEKHSAYPVQADGEDFVKDDSYPHRMGGFLYESALGAIKSRFSIRRSYDMLAGDEIENYRLTLRKRFSEQHEDSQVFSSAFTISPEAKDALGIESGADSKRLNAFVMKAVVDHLLEDMIGHFEQWREIAMGEYDDIESILEIENIEMRMAALQIYGEDKMLSEYKGAVMVDVGQKGAELWRVEDLFDEKAWFLKYEDPSTGQTYVSGVAPWIGRSDEDADEAMAWKFGITKEQYLNEMIDEA